MRKTLEAQICMTTVLVLEELGYLLPSEELKEEHLAVDMSESVRIDFDGERCGSLRFCMSGATLAEMSANMLGCEHKPDPGLCRDALGEFASVLCGNLLPAVYGCSPAFDIAPPIHRDGEEFDRPKGRLAGRAEVGIESGGRAEALLFIAYDDKREWVFP